MTDVPKRQDFETAYTGQAPWDIGRPQQAFLAVADRISGSVLDAGCGTGENALFFASRGHKVTGIDFLEEPISRARRKATERGLSATFLVKDALTLKDWTERFDTVTDSGRRVPGWCRPHRSPNPNAPSSQVRASKNSASVGRR
jgi:SAM-dependent methyltransferase